MRRGVVMLALIGAASVIVFWARSGPRERAGAPLPPSAQAPDEEVPTDSAAAPEPAAPTLARESRRSVADSDATAPRMAGTVVDAEGRAVAGASLRWSPFPDAALDRHVAREEVDGEALEAVTMYATSDPGGAFAFSSAPSGTGQRPSFLWVLHPDHRAKVVVQPLGEVDLPRRIQLARAPALTVRVVDAGGEPVAGVEVTQTGIGAPGISDRRDWLVAAAHRLLHLRHTTGADGRAALVPFEHEQRIRATKDGAAALPRVGRMSGEIEVTLEGGFRAGGLVRWEATPEELPSVVCSLVRGRNARVLSTAGVASDGSWRSSPLARADGVYRFALQGGDALARTVEREPPPLGEDLRIDFDHEVGEELWALVRDADGATLYDALVLAHWTDERARWSALSARPFPPGHAGDGKVRFSGLPPGSVLLEARAPGFAPGRTATIGVPEDPPLLNLIVLEPGGALEGRVLQDGVPAEDFQISVWAEEGDLRTANRFFSGRNDGTFRIDDAPAGHVAVLASSPDRPQSAVAFAEIDTLAVARVELALTPGIRAGGRVLDAETLAPVTGAEVQRWNHHAGRLVSRRGGVVAVDDDGGFEIDALVPGINFLQVSAPGYSTTYPEVVVGSDGTDVGAIHLTRAQPLEVRIHVPDDEDPTEYRLYTTGPESLSGFSFGRDGVARIPSLAAGHYLVNVVDPYREATRTALVELAAGDPWLVEMTFAPLPRVIVELGDEADGIRTVDATFRDGGRSTVTVNPGPDGLAILEGVGPGVVELRAFASSGERIAHRSLHLSAGEERRVDLRAAGVDQLVRVLDPAGEPVAGAAVLMTSAERPDLSWLREETGPAGSCVFEGVEPGAYRLFAKTSQGETSSARTVAVREPPEEHRVQLGLAELEVAVVRAGIGVGVDGAACSLSAGGTIFPVGERRTDASGVVRWSGLGAGEYRLSVTAPGLWPSERSLGVTAGMQATTVELRRTLDVELRLVDAAGASVSGARVELVDIALDASVSEWIAAGRVQVASAGGLTDLDGTLALQGLPEGTYRWRTFGDRAGAGLVEVREELENYVLALE